MKVLTCLDLDEHRCENPDCTAQGHHGPIVLLPRCHPRAGLQVTYQLGVLEVCCNRCKAPAAMIAVAKQPEAFDA